ncbi:MAG: A/G-specific adenine glycosylase [Bacteroidales bacterium]|nr:A/G-specific adenine glycosylase [Bacteroidales bacterium]
MHSFSETILDWYDVHGRDLPWRRTRDPYAIWLSEIILQQTRIAQGQAYWERFLQAFPDVQALAAADEDEVLRLWQGLGYYSRARNLHAAARQIAALGRFPDTLEGIRALKGVGDYTAAAIASFAFGIPAAVVDGNVYRVLARHFGIATPVGSTAAKKEFTALAQSLIPQDRPGDFNQAMMDFGATQCTPASPACLLCPLAASCKALATGQTDRLPVRQKGPDVQTRRFDYVYVRFQGRTAIRKRGTGDIWAGLFEPLVRDERFSGGADDRGKVPPDPLGRSAPKCHLQLMRKGVKHQLTHRTLLVDFYLWEPAEEPLLPEGYFWIEEAELERYAKPRLFELLLEALPK